MAETLIKELWATSPNFHAPVFVGAVAESLDDAWPEVASDLQEKAEQWFADFGDDDGPWNFHTHYRRIEIPGVGAAWWAGRGPRDTPGQRCGCRETCGDDGDIDGPGTCKGLPRAPEPPLLEIVVVPRGLAAADALAELAQEGGPS